MDIVLVILVYYNSGVGIPVMAMVSILVVMDWSVMGNRVCHIFVIDMVLWMAMVVSKNVVRIYPVFFIVYLFVECSIVYSVGCTVGMERIIIDYMVGIIEVWVRSGVWGCQRVVVDVSCMLRALLVGRMHLLVDMVLIRSFKAMHVAVMSVEIDRM